MFSSNPYYFTNRATCISSISEFRSEFSKPLRDFNTAGVVCAHLGKLLSSMKQGYYSIYNTEVKVNADKIEECTRAIDEIISIIS